MDKNSNSFVMSFAVGMCIVLAVMLAGTFNVLKDRMDANVAFDQHVNVLIATGLHSRAPGSEPKTREELEDLYASFIVPQVLEVKRGVATERVREAGVEKDVQVERVIDMIETDYAIDDLPNLRLQERRKPNAADRREFTTFFTRFDSDDPATRKPVAYCIPIEGLGLWGTIYGYLALESDLDHVRGITFYKHKETPGLGGEIDAAWWQSQWPQKKILDDRGEFVSVSVKKGQVDPAVERERLHMVDGLSGATITSNGVTRLVESCLQDYMPWFARLRQGK
ncbi:MAG: NADH:ubiquinone reductase (Na(+)-transporting) subunit C [Planctomycetes bacterium]|nr:NADH:ubiquinone reductase (Na(+)-transporting) subunit C [Planctomycetota bacterium]